MSGKTSVKFTKVHLTVVQFPLGFGSKIWYRLDMNCRRDSSTVFSTRTSDSIFIISGTVFSDGGFIEKLSWDGNIIIASEVIDFFPNSSWFYKPIVFKTNHEFCS